MSRENYAANLPSSANQLQFQPQSLMSFNYGNALSPMERGSLAVRNRNDFIRNIWGVPTDLAPTLETSPNMQPMDLIGLYKERSLEIPSVQLTAMILNGQASWLTDSAVPIFPTSDFNFVSRSKEMNCIEFTRTAAGGIPNQQTYRATSWKDTIEKVQLNARLEMDLSLDPNYGEEEWLFQLTGLAANAMLTIHKTAAYSIVHIAYTNLVGENIKENPYDLSRLLAKEEANFGLAAFDQNRYLRAIRDMDALVPDFDLVIIPSNAVSYIANLLGEQTSMQSQKVITDPVTGNVLWSFAQGKKSVGTIQFAEKTIHFVEMPKFQINMVLDAQIEKPLQTSVTIGQVYPPDPDVKAEDNILSTREDNLDIKIFFQTKNQGDERKISIKEAYGAAFYWDEKSRRGDGLSDYAHSFVHHKTQGVISNSNLIPWEYNDANNKRKNDNDINTETGFDNNTPNMDYIVGKEQLLDQRGWRERFFGVTYDPVEKIYRLPKRIADFELWAIPNKWIHKSARAIAHVANSCCNVDLDGMMAETFSLLDDLNDVLPTDEYLKELINANVDRMYNYNRVGADGTPAFEPSRRAPLKKEDGSVRFENASQIDEWKGNRFGTLDPPRRTGLITETNPFGFGNGHGLERLAKEADDDQSEWREVGIRAKKVISFWRMFSDLLTKYIGPNDLNDPDLTMPWYEKKSDVAVMIDHFMPYRAPVFLAVPRSVRITRPASQKRSSVLLSDEFLQATRADVAFFKGTNENPSDSPVSNVAKFISVLDTYTTATSTPSETQVDTLGGKLIAYVANNSGVYPGLLNRLIDFTVSQIVDKPSTGSVTKQLNILAYIARRIHSAVGGEIDVSKDKNLEGALVRIGKELDSFSINTKASKSALELYEGTIEKDSTIQAYQKENGPKIAPVIKRIKDQEERVRNIINASREVLADNGPSYDVQVRNVNDFIRFTRSPPQNDEDVARLDRATRFLTDNGIAQPTNEVTGKPSIYLNLADRQTSTFLRAPITGGNRLYEYLQRTPNPLVKPSDPAAFHERVLEIVTPETMKHSSFATRSKTLGVSLTALPFSQTFRRGLGLNSSSTTSNGNVGNDIFGDISTKSKKKYASNAMDISQFMSTKPSASFGDKYDDDFKKSAARKDFFGNAPQNDDQFLRQLKKEEYFGPIESREAYSAKYISSQFEKAIYKAICMAPNRILIHERLAAIGQKLVNVLIFRLNIQHVMSSTIVMKMGGGVLRMAVGHGRVWVSVNQQGINTINAGFYLGTVRVRPNAITMLPFTFPDEFVGGMNIDYMRDISHFHRRTNEKESMIVVLSPVSESLYQYPLHVLNLKTYQRRDTVNAPWLAKWSSSEYITHVLREKTLTDAQGRIENDRKSYGYAYDCSLVAHRGPVRYSDPSDPHKSNLVAGTGPRGHIRMNKPGAEQVFSGLAIKFPE